MLAAVGYAWPLEPPEPKGLRMTATVCAWCKVHAGMTPVSVPKPGPATYGEPFKWVQAAFVCTHCKKLSVGTTIVAGNALVPESGLSSPWWEGKKIHWTPEQVGGRDFPDVPDHIASAADEAYRCRSIGTLRSTILMARAVIEATCKDRGATKGLLAAKIDELAAKELIRSYTKDAAHELRHLGNNMAHGDFVEDVEDDDADAVLAVMTEILGEVYQGPARAAQMKAKREAAKQASGTKSS